jgi:hypothetical protein
MLSMPGEELQQSHIEPGLLVVVEVEGIVELIADKGWRIIVGEVYSATARQK